MVAPHLLMTTMTRTTPVISIVQDHIPMEMAQKTQHVTTCPQVALLIAIVITIIS